MNEILIKGSSFINIFIRFLSVNMLKHETSVLNVLIEIFVKISWISLFKEKIKQCTDYQKIDDLLEA